MMSIFRIKAILIVIVLTFYVCPLVTLAALHTVDTLPAQLDIQPIRPVVDSADDALLRLVHALDLAVDITVDSSGDLQAAINSAQVGDRIVLPPDGVYTGNFVFSRSITVEANGAKIVTPNADPAINILPNTDNVTIRGADISASGFVHDIVRIGTSGAAQDTLEEVPTNITLDNVQIHGDPFSDSQRGVAANGANVTITNSRIYEIHFRGVDSQAIGAWNGPGPFLISNSYLEAAGENILFGGADPSIPNLIPSDISIVGNHLFKPLSWKVGDPSYAGIHWTIKNLLELKMARNVLIDRNLLENSWGDAQIGYGALFTVRNQNGKAPWATIENVTYSNNVMRNTGQGFQLLGRDSPNISEQASGLKIVNNLFENIAHWGFVINGYNDVTFEHNTHFQGHNIIVFDGRQSLNFVYRNNATVRDPRGFGIFGSAVGEGLVALNTFAPGWVVEGSVIAGADARFYPLNNHYPKDLSGLDSLTGTDGLTPGFMGIEAEPEPSPSPTVTPLPSPSPSPLPSPSPSPSATPVVIVTRVVAWPNAKSKQDVILEAQWRERFRLKRNLSGQFAEFEFVP